MPTTRPRKSGGSMVMIIAPPCAAQNGMNAGSRVSVQMNSDELVVKPGRQRKTLTQLLAATPAATSRVDGWDYTQHVGAEI